MKRVYLDNASTSFPRSPLLGRVLGDYIEKGMGNVGRGQYAPAYELEERILEARETASSFFNAPDPSRVVFTSGGTASLNLFIKGFLKKGDHVIVSPFEHNAVMRPLDNLMRRGVIGYDIMGVRGAAADPASIERLARPNTVAVICVHASNVSGAIQDVVEIGRAAHAKGLVFCVDSCQSAGCIEVDVQRMSADFLAFTGHKGLLGLPGVGGAVLGSGIGIEPLTRGGTGSLSDSFQMPKSSPDRYEAGTLNIPGILSLKCGMDFLMTVGASDVLKHKLSLRNRFIGALRGSKIGDRIKAVAPEGLNCGIASISVQGVDISLVADVLDRDYGVCVRTGLHCAPLAHKSLGTFDDGGTIRFSFSWFNTPEEADYAASSLCDACVRLMDF